MRERFVLVVSSALGDRLLGRLLIGLPNEGEVSHGVVSFLVYFVCQVDCPVASVLAEDDVVKLHPLAAVYLAPTLAIVILALAYFYLFDRRPAMCSVTEIVLNLSLEFRIISLVVEELLPVVVGETAGASLDREGLVRVGVVDLRGPLC